MVRRKRTFVAGITSKSPFVITLHAALLFRPYKIRTTFDTSP